MFHSIIIPHRHRHKRLEWCIWSIKRSAMLHGEQDFEIVVIDSSTKTLFPKSTHVRVLPAHVGKPGFNKCAHLNQGIEASCGEVLTFLDADAIVGPSWITAAYILHEASRDALTRLCYRVRLLPDSALNEIERSHDPADTVTRWFRDYERFSRAAEAYWAPHHIVRPGEEPAPSGRHVFGNSQFSIRRDVLRDLRCDAEAFPSSGYEDIDFIHRIWARYGETYQGMLVTGDRAMLHIHNMREPEWYEKEQNKRQYAEYGRRLRVAAKGTSPLAMAMSEDFHGGNYTPADWGKVYAD